MNGTSKIITPILFVFVLTLTAALVREYEGARSVKRRSKMTLRTRWLRPLLGVMLVVTINLVPLDTAVAQQKPKLRPLHIALANHSVSMTAIYVAKHLGIFEKHG